MATIVTNTKNVRHKDKTLDKVLDNIKDGTIIASKTQLGNVKIGDNITVDDDGTISAETLKTTAMVVDSIPLGAVPVNRISKRTSPEYNRIYVPGATTNSPGVVRAGTGLKVNNIGMLYIDSAHIITNVKFSASVPNIQYNKGISAYFSNNPKEIVRCAGLDPSDYNNVEQFVEELLAGDIVGSYIVTFCLYNEDTDNDDYIMLHGLFRYDITVVSGNIDAYNFLIGSTPIIAL